MSQRFEDLLWSIYNYGEVRGDRTGTGTRSLFAPEPLKYDLRDSAIPLITSKAVPWKMALREYMWMLSGSTNVNDLAKSSPAMANLWRAWANPEGYIGPTYGAQYRDAGGSLSNGVPAGMVDVFGRANIEHGVDQLAKTVKALLDTPNTRRAVISLWSVPELTDMGIEPCMVLFQFSLRGQNYDKLDLHIYQRSSDMMLGVPFDLFQGGLLTHLIARELTLISGKQITGQFMTWSTGDAHIYNDQMDAAAKQLEQWQHAGPMTAKLLIDPFPSLRLLNGTLEPGHIAVSNYFPMPKIDAGTPAV